jgi:TIR domain
VCSLIGAPASWLFQKAVDFLFAYDFFIAYAWADARDYAIALTQQLRKQGFECFLDSKEYARGDDWRIVGRRALQKTKTLLLLGSPGAVNSNAVLLEVEAFETKNRTILPIDFGNTLRNPDRSNKLLRRLSPTVLTISADFSELHAGPSENTLREIRSSFDHTRQQQKRLHWLTGASSVFAIVAAFAVSQCRQAGLARGRAEEQARVANRQLGNVDWLLGVRARDNEKDIVRSGHFFFRSAKEFESAGDPALARNATLIGVLASRGLVAAYTDISGAVFHRDGSRILTWAGNEARLWAVDKNEPPQIFKHEELVNGAVFNRDESRILTWGGHTARLWAVDKKEPLQKFEHGTSVNGAEFSRDGSRILTWAGNEARLWDGGQKEPLQKFEHDASVIGAEFNPDGSRILTWAGNEARLWDGGQKEPLQKFEHDASVIGAEFNPDGSRILTWCEFGTAQLWTVGHNEAPPDLRARAIG